MIKDFREVLQFNDHKGNWVCENKDCNNVLAGRLDLGGSIIENKGTNKQEIKIYGGIVLKAVCRKCGHLNEFWTLRFTKEAIKKVIAENVFGLKNVSLLPKDVTVDIKVNYPERVYQSLAEQSVRLTQKIIESKLFERKENNN